MINNNSRYLALLAGVLLAIAVSSPQHLRAQTTDGEVEGQDNSSADPLRATAPEATRTGQSTGLRIVRAGGRAGAGAYPDKHWGVTALVISNDSEEPAEVEATLYMDSDPNQRFNRRLWIPARAARQVLVPIYVDTLPEGRQRRSTVVVVKDLKTGEPLRSLGGPPEHTLPVSAVWDDYISAMPMETAPRNVRRSTPDGGSGTQALRFSLKHRVPYGSPLISEFPDFFLALDAVDQITISNDSLQRDAGSAATVREWVAMGGQLWVMLDEVDEETVYAALGGDIPFQIVDRVTLTEFELKSPENEKGRFVRSENPIPFARVLLDPDVEALYSIDGWPAAFLVPRGEGRVLVTTLGISPWLRSDGEPMTNWGAGAPPPYLPQPELHEAAQRLSQKMEQPAATAEDFQNYLSERVGYRVTSGRTVGAILVGFVLTLLVSGIVLQRRQALARIIVVAPVAAAVTTLILVGLGSSTTSAIPRTVGAVQWIKVGRGMAEGSVEGQIAFYHPDRGRLEAGAVGGIFQIDASGQDGIARSLRWQDHDEFVWDDLTLPAGLRFASWRRPISFTGPPLAHVNFGENLVMSGQLRHAPWKNLEDGVLLFPFRPPVPVEITADGALKIRSDEPLGAGQFVPGRLLNDEQRRRQDLLRAICARTPKSGFPAEPTLAAWTTDEPVGLKIPGEARRFQSSLVTIPVEIHLPPAGEPVAVANSFISLRTAMSPLGEGQSAVLDHVAGEWVESRTSTTAWLRFRLPRELRDLEVESAVLSIDLQVPSRRVEYRTYDGTKAVDQGVEESPAGPRTFQLRAGEDFTVDDEGGILFGFKVSEAETDDERKPAWKVNYMRMNVRGRIR